MQGPKPKSAKSQLTSSECPHGFPTSRSMASPSTTSAHRRRAVAVPHRAAATGPTRVGGRQPGHFAGEAPLDLVRSPRGRRVRSHEPLPRRRTRCRGDPGPPGLHAVADRHVRPSAGSGLRRARCRARHRWAPAAVHSHAARTARLGGRSVVRRDHVEPARRRPFHLRRQMPGTHRIRLYGTSIGCGSGLPCHRADDQPWVHAGAPRRVASEYAARPMRHP